MELKLTSKNRGCKPLSLGVPVMVCVFPDPVIPYANIKPMGKTVMVQIMCIRYSVQEYVHCPTFFIWVWSWQTELELFWDAVYRSSFEAVI